MASSGAGREPAPVPDRDCRLCPRLRSFRDANRHAHPDWHNAPVASFAPPGRQATAGVGLLVVGLAPGLRGANRTGRPFTGDFAGDILFPTLKRFGFTAGSYQARANDGLRLKGCRITNAVRCVPPGNKPTAAEVGTCRRFLEAEIAALPDLEIVLALGAIAHGAVLAALGLKRAATPFRHGAFHELPAGPVLADSYHCSRYNLNTGRLSEAMFEAVVADIRRRLDAAA
ncbi:MAG: uracil-DNA glycosylase [Alphaproteobacteria bacterium]